MRDLTFIVLHVFLRLFESCQKHLAREVSEIYMSEEAFILPTFFLHHACGCP